MLCSNAFNLDKSKLLFGNELKLTMQWLEDYVRAPHMHAIT